MANHARPPTAPPRKKRPKRQHRFWRMRPLTSAELRTAAFIATICLAAIALALRVYEPLVWTFLTIALGHTLPQLGPRQPKQ
jgi:hypothetical protein